MKSCQNGRSMIEMLGVLAIVGVLSVGGIAGYTKAMAKYKEGKLISQLSEMVIGIRSMFFNAHDFKEIDGPSLVRAGQVPAEMFDRADPTGTITHAYNGRVTVWPSLTISGHHQAFEIYAHSVTNLACIALASMDWGQDPSSGFVSLYIGPDIDGGLTAPLMETVYPGALSQPDQGIYTTGQHENAIPISPAKATVACSCNNLCTIGLKYI